MAKKIFVSYKHNDKSVQHLYGYGDTARAYVDYLEDKPLKNEVYKGEGDEDLSKFKDATIENHLKNKIHDSSITLVLISPNMKTSYEAESDQWIPWEVSYSLKEITRKDKTSHTNGMLAVVLPDRSGSYSYFIEKPCSFCNSRTLKTDTLFQILGDNMFNKKEPTTNRCKGCDGTIYSDNPSYIKTVKWEDFLSNKDHYLDLAISIKDHRKDYNITKEIEDGR